MAQTWTGVVCVSCLNSWRVWVGYAKGIVQNKKRLDKKRQRETSRQQRLVVLLSLAWPFFVSFLFIQLGLVSGLSEALLGGMQPDIWLYIAELEENQLPRQTLKRERESKTERERNRKKETGRTKHRLRPPSSKKDKSET